jgi:hypothetical protein
MSDDEKLSKLLHRAASTGRCNVVQRLIREGADINGRNHLGRTPLHSAAAWGHGNVIDVLCRAGADLNAQDDCGCTAFALAAIAFKGSAAHYLERYGADPRIPDNNGNLPLTLALEHEERHCVTGIVPIIQDALKRYATADDLDQTTAKPGEPPSRVDDPWTGSRCELQGESGTSLEHAPKPL